MKKFSKYKLNIIGIIIGGICGFLYWKQIGCITGTCPLKSHWQSMIPFGMLLGYIFLDIIQLYFNRFEYKKTQ